MPSLRDDLRLIVITDREAAGARDVVAVVEAALRGGARTIQLREKDAGAGAAAETARRLRPLTRRWDARLIVNDRFDVALASDADGVHLGPDDLPVAAVRAAAPEGFVIGHSTDDPDVARSAEAEGADYIGCGAVYGTASKAVGDEAIGPGRLDEVARAVSIPVVGIGGIDPRGAREVAGTAAAGVAVIRAVMAGGDPEAAARALLEPFVRRAEEG